MIYNSPIIIYPNFYKYSDNNFCNFLLTCSGQHEKVSRSLRTGSARLMVQTLQVITLASFLALLYSSDGRISFIRIATTSFSFSNDF